MIEKLSPSRWQTCAIYPAHLVGLHLPDHQIVIGYAILLGSFAGNCGLGRRHRLAHDLAQSDLPHRPGVRLDVLPVILICSANRGGGREKLALRWRRRATVR